MSEIPQVTLKAYERAIVLGDLASLSEEEKLAYYQAICASVGLNPLSKPFDFTTIRGSLALFANASCAAQLRQLHGISVTDLQREFRDGMLLVTIKVQDKAGRCDLATGVVPYAANVEATAQDRAHQIMAAETKAKRRATLSLCGLGMLDESEIESIRQQEREAISALPKPTVAPAINQEAAPVVYDSNHESIIGYPPVPKLETTGAPFGNTPSPIVKPAAPPITRPVAPPPVARPVAPALPPNPRPASAPPVGHDPASLSRVPQVDGEAKDTPAEIQAVADAVARDRDPKPSVAQNPEKKGVSLQEIPAGEAPATQVEYTQFVNNRAAKIVRDKLKDVKNAGPLMKDYLLRESGKDKLQKISAPVFEKLLGALEAATVEDAVKILKGGK